MHPHRASPLSFGRLAQGTPSASRRALAATGLLAALLFPAAAVAAPIRDRTATASGAVSAGGTLSWGHSPDEGGVLALVAVAFSAGNSTPAAAWDGSAMTLLWREDGPSGAVAVFWTGGVPEGNSTVVVTNTGFADDWAAGSLTYTGAHQRDPTTAISSGHGAAPSASEVVASSSGETVVDFIGGFDAAGPVSLSAGGSQTQHFAGGTSRTWAGASESPGGGGVTMAWTVGPGSASWAQIVLALQAPQPPGLSLVAASGVTATDATLGATADPEGASTRIWWRVYPSDPGACVDSGGQRWPAAGDPQLASNAAATAVTTPCSGLSAATTYWLCGFARNSAGTTASPVVTFTTPAGSAATHLRFLGQPSSVTAGQTMAPPVTVEILDAGNARVGGATNAVTLALTSPGGATLSGTLTANAVAGVATFADLAVDRAGTRTLTATASGLSPDVSAGFTVSPGPAARLAVSAPARAVACEPVTVSVAAFDAYANPTTAYAGRVHFTSSDPAAVLPADYTFQPGDAGTHDFPGVVLHLPGNPIVSASDGALTGVATLAVAAGPADAAGSTLAFDEGPSPLKLAAQLGRVTARVRGRDACGNVAVLPSGGGVAVVVEPPLAVGPRVDVSGEATFAVTLPACTAPGLLGVTARLGGAPVGPPTRLEIDPVCTPPDPDASSVAGGGGAAACWTLSHDRPAEVPPGLGPVRVRFTVTPVDTSGLRMGAGHSVAALPDPPRVLADPTIDNGDGTYSIDLGSDACAAAARTATVSVDGVALTRKATATFSCAPADPARSTVVATPARAEVGAAIALAVTARDVCDLPTDGRGFAVTLEPDGLAAVSAPATMDPASHADASLVAPHAGSGTATALVDGIPVGSAPVEWAYAGPLLKLELVAESSGITVGETTGFTATVTALHETVGEAHLDLSFAGIRLVEGSFAREGKPVAIDDGLAAAGPIEPGRPVVLGFRATALPGAAAGIATARIVAKRGGARLSDDASARVAIGRGGRSGCGCGLGGPGILVLLPLALARRRR